MSLNITMDDWSYNIIPVPPDGSCFFTSISMAMNESMDEWILKPKIKDLMQHHWDRFNSLKIEETDHISPKFIRYMCASAMDEHSLIMFNEEASSMKEKKFEKPEELARHILYSNCWGDQSMIRSFMQSMKYMVCLVVFDVKTRKPIYTPKEWTYNKEMYICLHIERSHYTPLRLQYKGEDLDLCVDRKTIRKFMSICSDEYDFKSMY